jgi:alkanesulfonate monooxygenase SsuD/methylene tetrahydromethanopterin reductase-like flavin-dependent oxidoreductase (luciferase family)
LWTEQIVTHTIGNERIVAAGLSPLPVQRPIPIWLGGQSPAAYRRAGRLADGWFPQIQPGQSLDDAIRIVSEAALAAGRDSATLGMEGRVSWRGNADEAAIAVARWRDAGATHISINTMNAGLATVDDHLRALDSVAAAVGIGR